MRRVAVAVLMIAFVEGVAVAQQDVGDCDVAYQQARVMCRMRSVPEISEIERNVDAGRNGWRTGDVMNFAYRHNGAGPLQLVGGIQLPLTRVEGTDLWVLSVYVPDLDRAFFTYSTIVVAPGPIFSNAPDATFGGPKANPRRARSSVLHGRMVRYDFESAHLNGSRRLDVYVPPPAGNTPIASVVYMADGTTVAQYAAAVDTMIAAGKLPRVLLVGVASSDEPESRGLAGGREMEYIMGTVSGDKLFEAHERFFIEEVLPWAQRTYGAPIDREKSVVFGGSAGGAFALTMGLRHPDRFANVIAFSPSPVRAGLPDPNHTGFYLWAGLLEPAFHRSAMNWAATLRSKGADVVLRDDVAGHDLEAWIEELPEGLEWAFATKH